MCDGVYTKSAFTKNVWDFNQSKISQSANTSLYYAFSIRLSPFIRFSGGIRYLKE